MNKQDPIKYSGHESTSFVGWPPFGSNIYCGRAKSAFGLIPKAAEHSIPIFTNWLMKRDSYDLAEDVDEINSYYFY